MNDVGMTLVIRGDASGVVVAMKDATNNVRTFATEAQRHVSSATRNFQEMKKEVSRARETMMFLTQSLAEFGPAGRTAQLAISGIGTALMTGGVLGIGLAAAQVGVRLLTDWWEADAKAAKEAADAHKQAAEAAERAQQAISRDANARRDRIRDLVAEADGLTKVERAEKELKMLRLDLALATGAYKGVVRQRIKDVEDLIVKLRELEATDAWKKLHPEGFGARGREVPAAQIVGSGAASPDQLLEPWMKEAQKSFDRVGLNEEWIRKQEDAAAKVSAVLAQEAERAAQAYVMAAGMINQAFANIGQIIGGQAGAMAATIGKMIEQAIQLAVAMAATGGGPLGWLNAAVAATALIATITSIPAQLHSAAGGFDVPAGVNPITQLHAREMVLPEKYADIIRSGAIGGITVNIAAADAKDVRRLFMENNGALAEAIGRAVRDGRRFG